MRNKIKKFLLIVVFLQTITSNLFSQTAETKKYSPQLMNIQDVIEGKSFDKILWQIVASDDDKYKPIKAEGVMTYINTYLSKNPTENKRTGEIKEFNLIKKYSKNFDSTFDDFRILPSGDRGNFVFTKEWSNPIHFGLYNDTALSLLISGLYIDKVYNAIKLTSRQRATKVVMTYILPQLIVFLHEFKTNEIKYFGMTCVYGCKDFGDESPNATKGEFVGFIAPKRLISKYVLHTITEDEFINAADIYISDRDMGIAEIKKIKIVLE